MENNCSKYESLFTFSDEKTLNEHIQECDACRAEHEKMQQVSELLDEVKFYYRAKNKKKKTLLRAMCASMVLLFTTCTFGVFVDSDDLMDTLRYGDSLSAEEMGFPVDSYGLLMVD